MTLIVFGGPNITSLEGFRACREEGLSPFYRVRPDLASRARTNEPPFDPASILVQDRWGVGRYGDQMVTLLGLGGPATIVAGYPQTAYSNGEVSTPVELVERGLYGVSRQSFGYTSVEIAGKNLYSTPAPEIIVALQERGSTIISSTQEPGRSIRMTYLSPPTGLDGVTRVQVQMLNRHTLMLAYFIRGEADYMTFVGLLDGRYGRSTARAGTGTGTGTGTENRSCRFRSWRSGSVNITGELCPQTAT
jgi:hypothetical protein